jgi:hypothetical protein
MKKHSIKGEIYGLVWGTILIIIGLVILLFVFVNALDAAQNPMDKIEQWVPDEVKGPTSHFNWWSNDTSVDFSDMSFKGDYEISMWIWDFGDGHTSNNQNPDHEYSSIRDYTVSLEVEDENGESHISRTRISLVEGEYNQGESQSNMPIDLGFDVTFKRLTISVVFFAAFAILVMIGGRILFAGCRLISPNIKFLKMKVKPKEIEEKIELKEK